MDLVDLESLFNVPQNCNAFFQGKERHRRRLGQIPREPEEQIRISSPATAHGEKLFGWKEHCWPTNPVSLGDTFKQTPAVEPKDHDHNELQL
ncbi:MAG: hypothetical protein NT154_40505 [Verrucomicrobia bacterium]|nr:hypothetical protein [Verrucomicrobiota bacterium]